MAYAWLDQGQWVQEGYAWPPEMPPPTDDDDGGGYAWPPEMPPPTDDDDGGGYAWPPEMPPPKPSELPHTPPKPKEAGMDIGWHTLIVLGGFAYLGYYYFRRR